MDESVVQPPNSQEKQEPKKQLPPAAKVMCSQCQTEMVVKIPRPRIFNGIDVSILAFAHERFPQCPNCKAAYTFSVDMNEVGLLSFIWVMIKPAEPIITPGTPENVQQEIQKDLHAAGIASKIKLN